MDEKLVRSRLQLAHEVIQRELQRCAEDLPGYEISLEVDWINVTSIERRHHIPTIRMRASVEAP